MKRTPRSIILAAVAAAALTPANAFAADDTTDVSGTLTAGQLAITAPAAVSDSLQLDARSGDYELGDSFGAWSVSDATGSADGWELSVSATDLELDDIVSDSATDGIDFSLARPVKPSGPDVADLSLGGTAGTAASLRDSSVTVLTAGADEGAGLFQFNSATASDRGGVEMTLPYDAKAGAYTSTLTFTISTPVL